MPHNVSFGQNGLPPPFININSSPMSPISSVPSPGSVASSGHNPQSPFSLGPDTPPPAYSPQDDKALLPTMQPPPPPQSNLDHQMETNTAPVTGSGDPVPYQESDFWSSIAYYELNSRVGEVYHAQVIMLYDRQKFGQIDLVAQCTLSVPT